MSVLNYFCSGVAVISFAIAVTAWPDLMGDRRGVRTSDGARRRLSFGLLLRRGSPSMLFLLIPGLAIGRPVVNLQL